jgi:hypothetical protein
MGSSNRAIDSRQDCDVKHHDCIDQIGSWRSFGDLSVLPKETRSTDPSIRTQNAYDGRTSFTNVWNSNHDQLDHDTPITEVFMTPMVGDDISLSGSTIASVQTHTNATTCINNIAGVNSAGNGSLTYITPSKPKELTQSWTIQNTPEGLKPRPNFRSMQNRIESTIASDEFSLHSHTTQSLASNSSRWSQIGASTTNNTYRLPHRKAPWREILPTKSEYGRPSNNSTAYSYTLQQKFRNGWDSKGTLMPAIESDTESNEMARVGLPSTPQTPLLESASSAKTAVGAMVAQSMNTNGPGESPHSSATSRSHRSQYSMRSSRSYRSIKSKYSTNSSYSENESTGQNWMISTAALDFDVDYEPITEVGKVVKELCCKKHRT